VDGKENCKWALIGKQQRYRGAADFQTQTAFARERPRSARFYLCVSFLSVKFISQAIAGKGGQSRPYGPRICYVFPVSQIPRFFNPKAPNVAGPLSFVTRKKKKKKK
jgi:hypothetical protein